jgi:UDP-N-acetylglucosamine 4,6-dehydratase
MNVIDQAIDAGVKKVIALSTDKAVNPANLYGATKLCSDRLFIAGNSYVGKRGFPIFSVVRYGNVLGTRGSVIPHWEKLIAEGVDSLPITDSRMTRFWITLDQAIDFVMECFGYSRGGEIYVPKIPSMRIEDLALAMAPKLKHSYSGIRAGEKLHELMIGVDDGRHTREYDNHYMIVPEIYSETPQSLERFLENRPGKKLPDGFSYGSDTNTKWLSIDDLKKYLAASGK